MANNCILSQVSVSKMAEEDETALVAEMTVIAETMVVVEMTCVTAYYNEILTLWQDLDLCYDDNWRCTKDSVLYFKRQENDRVFMFLVGLNKDLDEVGGLALAIKNLDEGKRLDKFPWCDHYKREWHMHETCQKLKGKSPNWKKKCRSTFQASNYDQGQQSPLTQLSLTMYQLDRLYKLLESLTPSCSIARKDHF
ncbi:hypothetical protein KIW84_045559 [Lathyrus oleraceus]|uniref:Uncharacterized protein n=1 Tax=Pisum sativum TaxID=3888 RepID=A0A9D4XIU3_PEA|nr:hypothetical protein KIW84_045559 [Pisum sativum]